MRIVTGRNRAAGALGEGAVASTPSPKKRALAPVSNPSASAPAPASATAAAIATATAAAQAAAADADAARQKGASSRRLTKADFERLAEVRYRLRSFLRFAEESARSEGLTALQYQLLLQIRGFPGRSWALVGELAERLQSAPHGVVELISRCQRAGLVERHPGLVDRREVRVCLTPAGERAVERVARVNRSELAALVSMMKGAGLSGEARGASVAARKKSR